VPIVKLICTHWEIVHNWTFEPLNRFFYTWKWVTSAELTNIHSWICLVSQYITDNFCSLILNVQSLNSSNFLFHPKPTQKPGPRVNTGPQPCQLLLTLKTWSHWQFHAARHWRILENRSTGITYLNRHLQFSILTYLPVVTLKIFHYGLSCIG